MKIISPNPTPADKRRVPVFDPGKGRDICAAIFQSVSDGEYPTGAGESFETTSSLDPNAFYVVARGESMTGGAGRQEIMDGDLLLVEPNKDVRDGDFVLCRRLGRETPEALVKIFKRSPDGKITLVSLNPSYPSIIIKEKSAQEEIVFCRITEIKRKL